MRKLVQPDIIQQLRANILALEGFKPLNTTQKQALGLHIFAQHFPNKTFPQAASHEFVFTSKEQLASTYAFISVLLTQLYPQGLFIWIGKQQQIFNPGLSDFGLQAPQLILINLSRVRDVFWAVEETLKCKSIAAVLCEVPELDFIQSQRLQLHIEKNGVSAFILRRQSELTQPTACTVRWQVKPVCSLNPNQLPGLGYPRWEVELLKVRNGSTGKYTLTWRNQQLESWETNRQKLSIKNAKGA